MDKPDKAESIYWEKEIETLPRRELEKLQLERLIETIKGTNRIPFYQEAFNNASVGPNKTRSLDYLKDFPFTVKEDLRQRWPYGMLAVPLEDCVRVHASSGTTGEAVAVIHTERDLETWGNLVARCLYAVGVRKTDIFQNMTGSR